MVGKRETGSVMADDHQHCVKQDTHAFAVRRAEELAQEVRDLQANEAFSPIQASQIERLIEKVQQLTTERDDAEQDRDDLRAHLKAQTVALRALVAEYRAEADGLLDTTEPDDTFGRDKARADVYRAVAQRLDALNPEKV